MSHARHRRLPLLVRAGFATEQAIYGVLLVAGLIVAGAMHDAGMLSLLVTVVATVLVFWAAHVFAGTVSDHVWSDEARTPSLPRAIGASARSSAGLLLSAVVPCAFLALGALTVVGDRLAGWLALWSCIVLLGVLGYLAFQRRGAPVHVRIVGALITAGFGGLLALLKAFVH